MVNFTFFLCVSLEELGRVGCNIRPLDEPFPILSYTDSHEL